jgi:hypothetical protein
VRRITNPIQGRESFRRAPGKEQRLKPGLLSGVGHLLWFARLV